MYVLDLVVDRDLDFFLHPKYVKLCISEVIGYIADVKVTAHLHNKDLAEWKPYF
ncbi:7879_t:CDS:1, partial [Rhizophagus irregularis]